jgi:hypothetical protein
VRGRKPGLSLWAVADVAAVATRRRHRALSTPGWMGGCGPEGCVCGCVKKGDGRGGEERERGGGGYGVGLHGNRRFLLKALSGLPSARIGTPSTHRGTPSTHRGTDCGALQVRVHVAQNAIVFHATAPYTVPLAHRHRDCLGSPPAHIGTGTAWAHPLPTSAPGLRGLVPIRTSAAAHNIAHS